MFDGLKSLIQRGSAAEAPASVAAPEGVPTPQPIAEWTDPDTSGMRVSTQDSESAPAPRLVPVPAVAASKHTYTVSEDRKEFTQTRVTPEPAAVSSLPDATPLTDASGVVRGYLTTENKFILATAATPATALDHLSEADRRPVDPEEEIRTDLPERTPGRIQFLLATYEAGRMDLTQARIQNDLHRYHNSNTGALRANPQSRQVNPEASTPSVGMFHN
jgi:hypothetical protein